MSAPSLAEKVAPTAAVDEAAEEAVRPAFPTPAWLRWIDELSIIVLNVTLLAQVLLVFAATVLRSVAPSDVLMGLAETVQPFLITISFLGGAVSYSRGQFIIISFVIDRVSQRARDLMRGIGEWLVILISAPIAAYSVVLLAENYEETTLLWGIGYAWMTVPITLGAILFTVHAANALLNLPLRATVLSGLMAGGAATLFFLFQDHIGASPALLYTTLAAVFILLLAMAVPIGFIMAIIGTMCVLATSAADMTAVVMNAQRGSSGFILLALPFFILAGFIMDRADIGGRIVDFVTALIGHVRGGLLQVMVLGCYLGSCVSGSKAADMAMIGIPMTERLKRQGYPAHERAAVLAGAAAMAESVPPSIALILISSATGISTGALFVAGLAPAATLAVCLMILIRIRASLFGWPRSPRASGREVAAAGRRAILPLLMPVILIGGIIGGFGTPTEVSTFAVIYGIVLGVIYRRFTFATLWETLTSASMLNGMVFFTVSAAMIFSWALTLEGVTTSLASLASGFASFGFLMMVILITVAAAAILDSFVTILILAPLFLPIAQTLEVEPLQFGIVMAEAFGIGCVLPPIGIALYVACKISGARVDSTSRMMIWYLGMLTLGLVLVVLFPQITSFLPHFFGLKG